MACKPTDRDDPVLGVLRCLRCAAKINCRQSEAIRYARNDEWPRCCDQIMRFYGNDQLTEEYPVLQPG